MNTQRIDLTTIPPAYRMGFDEFVRLLAGLAGDNLRGLVAFGGWRVKDPFYDAEPARSVALLERIDLPMLDQLALHGAQLGKLNVSAPLMMTTDYIESSRDVFPLELLEIQRTGAPVVGDDPFADLRFEPRHVRLQCEREFKGELIHLRHGLLAAAGKRHLLAELCRSVTARVVRLLRGVLLLKQTGEIPTHAAQIPTHAAQNPADAAQIVAAAADAYGQPLPALAGIVAGPAAIEFDDFQRFYAEIDALARFVDALPE